MGEKYMGIHSAFIKCIHWCGATKNIDMSWFLFEFMRSKMGRQQSSIVQWLHIWVTKLQKKIDP